MPIFCATYIDMSYLLVLLVYTRRHFLHILALCAAQNRTQRRLPALPPWLPDHKSSHYNDKALEKHDDLADPLLVFASLSLTPSVSELHADEINGPADYRCENMPGEQRLLFYTR